jgi:hypothetical protein
VDLAADAMKTMLLTSAAYRSLGFTPVAVPPSPNKPGYETGFQPLRLSSPLPQTPGGDASTDIYKAMKPRAPKISKQERELRKLRDTSTFKGKNIISQLGGSVSG